MATARDVVVIMSVFFAMALGIFILHFTVKTVFTEMVTYEAVNESESAVQVFEDMDETFDRFDWLLFVFFMGLMLSLIITSWFVQGSPVYAFIYMVVVIIAVAVSALLANVWDTIANMAVFGTTLAEFPITNHLLSYFPVYIAGAGIIGLVVMFAKPRGEGGI